MQGLWTCANRAAFRDGGAALPGHGVLLWLMAQRVLGPLQLLVGAGHCRQLVMAGPRRREGHLRLVRRLEAREHVAPMA